MDLDAKAKKRRFWSTFLIYIFKTKITSAKIEKICWQINIPALMQPLQYDLNLDAAITMRSAKAELPNTIELRATASEIAAPKPKPDLDAKAKKKILKGFLKGKLLTPKSRKSADKSISQPWCSHSNTINDVQLQKRIVLRMQPLQPPYTEKHKVRFRAPASSPQHSPCNIHAAIPMRSATRDSRNA